MLLAGDIGGTKTVLAVYSRERGPRAPLVEAVFRSADYPSLEAIAEPFLAEAKLPVTRAVFAVAGPVVGGRAQITNLPWVMEELKLRDDLGLASVLLLNDLQAIGWAVPQLQEHELRSLNAGAAEPGGAIAVVAPGTGLGEGFLTWEGGEYRPHSSEGGHVGFAPQNSLEQELLTFMLQKFEHVSYERLASGMGLPNIYAFLKQSGRAEEPSWLSDLLAAAEDPTPIIVTAAQDPGRVCPICVQTLELFVSILGAAAGDLALSVLATGGVFLGGGIPPRILATLENGGFMRAFRSKGRFAALLGRVPVSVILDPRAGMVGMSHLGLSR